MIYNNWFEKEIIKKVKCVQINVKKYIVNCVLILGKEYEVKNEIEEFIFVIDNMNKVGGYYKEYFEEV